MKYPIVEVVESRLGSNIQNFEDGNAEKN